TLRGSDDGETEPTSQILDRAVATRRIESNRPAVHAIGVQPTQHEVGIRHGGLVSSEPIARWARDSPGAARTNLECDTTLRSGDRAPTGSDRLHREHRQPHRVIAELSL